MKPPIFTYIENHESSPRVVALCSGFDSCSMAVDTTLIEEEIHARVAFKCARMHNLLCVGDYYIGAKAWVGYVFVAASSTMIVNRNSFEEEY